MAWKHLIMTINILHESIKSDIVNLELVKLLFNRAGGKMSENVEDLKWNALKLKVKIHLTCSPIMYIIRGSIHMTSAINYYSTYATIWRYTGGRIWGENLFNSDVCDKSLSQRSTLIVHRRMHIWEKSFLCDFCVKRFNNKSDLIKRWRTHIQGRHCSIVTCVASHSVKETHWRLHTGWILGVWCMDRIHRC